MEWCLGVLLGLKFFKRVERELKYTHPISKKSHYFVCVGGIAPIIMYHSYFPVNTSVEEEILGKTTGPSLMSYLIYKITLAIEPKTNSKKDLLAYLVRDLFGNMDNPDRIHDGIEKHSRGRRRPKPFPEHEITVPYKATVRALVVYRKLYSDATYGRHPQKP